MDNLDALLMDLQAATVAMIALHDAQPESTAAEDDFVDATWGCSSSSPPAAPFPKVLQSPTGDSRNGWQNSSKDNPDFPSQRLWDATPHAVSPSLNGTSTAPLLLLAQREERSGVVLSPCSLQEQGSTAVGNGHLVTVSRRAPSSSDVTSLPAAFLRGKAPAEQSASGGITGLLNMTRDSYGGVPPPLPPPPSREVIDSFYRDMDDQGEPLYEPQNLCNRGKMPASPPLTAPDDPITELRWRAQQTRLHPAAGVTPVLRSSLAHNLCELDALLQELAAPQAESTPASFQSSTGRSALLGEPATVGRIGSSCIPLSPQSVAALRPEVGQCQQASNAPHRGALSNSISQNVDYTPHAVHQPKSSFATKELDDLMATLSQLKVGTALNGPHRYEDQHYTSVGPVDVSGAQQATLQQPSSPSIRQPRMPNGQGSVPAVSPAATASSGASSFSGSPAPSPRLPRGDLDHMLGHLETDLSRQGAGVVTKGNCAACCKQVVGQVVTALGCLWHPEHFCCSKCRCELAKVSFFERDGLPYCEHDYHELFAPKCARCGDAVISKCVTALGVTWHPQCFTCAACGRQLTDEGFHEKDDNVYCVDDFFDMFSPRCGNCAMPIYDNFVAALNRHWHPGCFSCMDCGAGFGGGSFFDHDGLPYCELHYHSRKGCLCAGCQKPVVGRCIAAMGKKFHPEHFVCAFCLRQLNKGTFKEQNDKPYCHPCFAKLFG